MKLKWKTEMKEVIKLFDDGCEYLEDIRDQLEYIENFAEENDLDCSKDSCEYILKAYLKKIKSTINIESMPLELVELKQEISKLGLFPDFYYKYGEGILLEIMYFEHFETDLEYFLGKSKEVYYPDSLKLQEVFGADKKVEYKLWLAAYKKWVFERFKKMRVEKLQDISKLIDEKIDSL